jgi:hypothetical protein
MPALLLRAEGLVVLAGALALYTMGGYGWLAFILLLFAPDLTMAGYVLNPRVGSIIYNLGHTYSLPLALALVSLGAGFEPGQQLALIWLAHIGLDRALGYGLKYATSFKDTHLARV